MKEVSTAELVETITALGFWIQKLDAADDPSLGEGFWFKVTPDQDEDGHALYFGYLEFEMDGSNYRYGGSDLAKVVGKCMKQGFYRAPYLAECETREAQMRAR